MNIEGKAYIAGFLDGDGCVMAQLVSRKGYVNGFHVRVSVVFYQKKSHKEILQWLKDKLCYGYIRDRNDGMSEYTIVGLREVKEVLKLLLPYLRLKKSLAILVLKIIQDHPKRMTSEDLIRLGSLVDQTAGYTYSKKRRNTSVVVKAFLDSMNSSPVETEAKAEIVPI